MSQTLAILVDSIRLLRSRSLFWLSLALSAIAAIALFGTYSFNEEGIRFLWMKTFENPDIAAGRPGSRAMVLYLFNGYFVKFWLSWGAILLAVISTSSIMPDFLADGAIDMTLSKPISRLRLFATKVLGSILFVTLQVAVSMGLAYLLIGVKFGMWLHESMLAIPLISLQFFYLYSISALIAVISRSTLASLLGTVLFWFAVFMVQFASNQLDSVVAQSVSMAQRSEERAVRFDEQAAEATLTGPLLRARADSARRQAEESRATAERFEPWQQWLGRVELVIPKTGDVQKILANVTEAPVSSEFRSLMGLDLSGFKPADMTDEEWEDALAAGTQGERAIREVNAAASLGTSTAFSLVVFAAGVFLFRRRDF